MNSIKVCEYSRSRSFHDDLMLQDQASGERFRTNGPLVVYAKMKAQIRCAVIDQHLCLHYADSTILPLLLIPKISRF